MADDFTQLADLIVPEVFRRYGMERSLELDAFIQSGIAVDMSEVVEDFGTTVQLPFFKALSGDDVVSDDNDDLEVDNIEAAQDTAVSLMRAKVFGATDLSAEVTGSDPMQAIIEQYAKYWAERRQAALLSSLAGQTGAASMTGNVLDITGLPGDAAKFDAESFIDACHKLGDHANSLAAVGIHSDTQKAMEKADLIDYEKDSEGREVQTYRGKRLIVDDTMPVSTGNYTTYIFGPGAVGFAQRARKNAVEPGRDPLKNNGRSYLVTREKWVMHLRGVRWTPGESVPVKASPSNAELATTTNWTRVWQNKNIRVVAFKHKL